MAKQADKRPETAIIVAKIALVGTILAAIVGATATITAALLQRGNRTSSVTATVPTTPTDRTSNTGVPTTTTSVSNNEAPTTTTTIPASERVQTASSQVAPAMYHVVYKITGTAPGASTITYSGDGVTQQETDVMVPWSKKLELPAEFFAQVSAQNDGGGTITCTIVVNGKTIKTATSTGDFAIASCNARISEA